MHRALNNAKIGNILRFLATEIPHLPLMKALKLLYLLDEASFKARGMSMTGLEYKAWRDGPVAKPVWLELRHGQSTYEPALDETFTFDQYIEVQRFQNEITGIEVNIEPKGAFEDDEFSRTETKLLKEIVAKYGQMNGYQLSKITHQPGTPWSKAVEMYGLQKRFDRNDNAPDVTVDLVHLIQDDEEKMDAYLAAQEAIRLKYHLYTYASEH